jgi:hypothetical protein
MPPTKQAAAAKKAAPAPKPSAPPADEPSSTPDDDTTSTSTSTDVYRDDVAELPSDGLDEQPAPSVKAGQLVIHWQFDAYRGAGGEDVERHGLVIAVDTDEDGNDGARIMWIDALSDPIALDELTVVE